MTTEPSAPILVAAITPVTEAEGPGRRFAVWAQGCSIRCSGCFNPHLWGTSGGESIEPRLLAQRALQAGVEGVTLLGGEPFDQADAFADFAEQVRAFGLTVMTFTGHYLEHLRGAEAPAGSAALLAATDLLVDGPYLADHVDLSRPWVGSTNQRFHFLSDRYATLATDLHATGDRLEIRVSTTGEIAINGWANVDMLDDLLDGTAPAIGRGSVR